ncbi:hypothetical protein P7K49_030078 [Saguinus oedipus]|uniref:Uncharacterized protein n=1 Tax=Saguinus oedipus TaxID=9490 RepID=A0ABQ9U164_SAGOE|nr:hypothetical protein P7K49_030078 [Saguinus oedipus]
MSTTGRGVTFTINCSGFGRHGADPIALNSVFERRAFRPVTNVSIPTRVNISFTMSAILDVVSADPSSPPECPQQRSSDTESASRPGPPRVGRSSKTFSKLGDQPWERVLVTSKARKDGSSIYPGE